MLDFMVNGLICGWRVVWLCV